MKETKEKVNTGPTLKEFLAQFLGDLARQRERRNKRHRLVPANATNALHFVHGCPCHCSKRTESLN
jgi:hypothetical protein